MASAEDSIETKGSYNAGQKIRIKADRLVAEVGAGEIEFIGNVKLTQAEAIVTADRLKIFYNPEGTSSKTQTLTPTDIEKIIAAGQVKIVYADTTAETDKAEYTVKSSVLVLTGPRSKVTQGGHSISGTKFTLHRSEGRLTVESSGENRVKAVFQPSKANK